MAENFFFLDKLIVRTPKYPYSYTLPYKIPLDDLEFIESIYTASPVLAKEMNKLTKKEINSEKIQISLRKYFNRMSTRCTPFGLFSGCSLINWSNTPSIVTLANEEYERHTRLDMHFLCGLGADLSKTSCIKPYLKYFPNNSIYFIGDELRYIEYIYINNIRTYHISSVFLSEYTSKIVNKSTCGISQNTAVELLSMETGVSSDEALDFFNKLIANQILVSELDPSITGEEYFFQIKNTLNRISQSNPSEEIHIILNRLSTVELLLNTLNQNKVNSLDKYNEIILILKEFNCALEEDKLFQTDTIVPVFGGCIDTAFQNKIMQALTFLNKLVPFDANKDLDNLKQRFADRYESKEVPLLEALDPENGLSYPEELPPVTESVLDNINFSVENEATGIELNTFEQFMNFKIIDCHKKKENQIELTGKDLQIISNKSFIPLPASLSVIFRLIHQDDEKIYFQSASGSSAVNLLARFGHMDNDICDFITSIAKMEQKYNPEIIFAEIVHLPQNRIGNVLQHPILREYEVAYLAKPSVKEKCQIHPSDLLVSVRNNEFLLRSKKLNKFIIPRLSNAHNFTLTPLPVYRFLCDIQTQLRKNELYFKWGNLSRIHHFLPRIIYEDVILSPSIWRFSKEDLKDIINAHFEISRKKFLKFKDEWHIPDLVLLTQGDNELLNKF